MHTYIESYSNSMYKTTNLVPVDGQQKLHQSTLVLGQGEPESIRGSLGTD